MCLEPETVTDCTIIQTDKSTQELNCTPPASLPTPDGYQLKISGFGDAPSSVSILETVSGLTPATSYSYIVQTV